MKLAIALFGLFAIASAGVVTPYFYPTTTLIRSPSDDSAIVHSERVGGNFAYSTLEGHAYKAITPVVQNVLTAAPVQWRSDLPLYAFGPRFAWAQPTIIQSNPAVTTLVVPSPGVSLVPADLPAAAPEQPESREEDESKPETEEKNEEELASDDTVSVEAN